MQEGHDPPLWPWYAAMWALLFAGVSLFWGFGGTAGLGSLSVDTQRDALEGGSRLLVVGILPGIVKLALAGLPLWIVLRGPDFHVVRVTWVVGALMLLYGVLMTGHKALMKAGAIDRAESLPDTRLDWALYFWNPIWIVGGLLFMVCAATAGRLRS